ncbi:hypothetical protein DdX_21406 [Ditylenchus destructor]|uniref:F-box domain-containing protein n=1 Tax=Ditylenchus destructor TaxID=166010 RepID=A0AAD4MEY4_9BILA|nr:hypothetical protein DdX_21406 [Ditylenchus destructor]
MVEAFKHLNYCQLAKSSLVSKRYRDLIRIHRHKLALLYVNSIRMHERNDDLAAIQVFNEKLSSDAYNEWVIRNHYSKQVPHESQSVGMQSAQYERKFYELMADATYEDISHRQGDDTTTVFSACIEFNDDNWPVFQHIVRLITDPFIYIGNLKFTYRNDFLNLLASAINADRTHLQCEELDFSLEGNSQKAITWTKDHVRCNKFSIFEKADLTWDESLWDFVKTGGHCTSSICADYHDVSKAMIEFVQMFLNIENWDEYQGVQCIESWQLVTHQDIQALKKDYASLIVKEEHLDKWGRTTYVFEFVNNAIGKKLKLLATPFEDEDDYWDFGAWCPFWLEINNL